MRCCHCVCLAGTTYGGGPLTRNIGYWAYAMFNLTPRVIEVLVKEKHCCVSVCLGRLETLLIWCSFVKLRAINFWTHWMSKYKAWDGLMRKWKYFEFRLKISYENAHISAMENVQGVTDSCGVPLCWIASKNWTCGCFCASNPTFEHLQSNAWLCHP